MAFNPENKQIKKALQKEEQVEPKDKLVIPVFNDEDERTKKLYIFTATKC